jgi:hypothetical protein
VKAAANLKEFKMVKPKGGQSKFEIKRKDGSVLEPDLAEDLIDTTKIKKRKASIKNPESK